jgi:hypothetical protein
VDYRGDWKVDPALLSNVIGERSTGAILDYAISE